MRLEQLHQVIEIEKSKSISKAAKALFISQSSLSSSLSSLEQEIGVKIFERTSNGVELLQEGEEILALAKQVCNCCSQILNFKNTTQELYGEVTLLITQAYGFLYSDILLAFKSRYPSAELKLEIRLPTDIIEEIARGTADIGVTLWQMMPEQNHEVLEANNIRYETFGKHRMMLYVSQDNQFAGRSQVSLPEIREEQFVAYSSGYWSSINKRVQAKNNPLVMTDRENLKRMISSGAAIALMPDTFAKHDLYCDQGLIQLIPLTDTDDFGQGVDHLLYPAKRELSLLQHGVLNILRDILSKLKS